jgi:SAM-dependent methyltransferase
MRKSKFDPRRILAVPVVYNTFQRAVRADRSRKRVIDEYIGFMSEGRVLEIGCGPGSNYELIPEGVAYVGTDLDESYIRYATKAYGDSAQFYECPVGQLGNLNIGKFQAILALNLLHHLDENQVLQLCDEVKELLAPDGRFITADPCFFNNQPTLERVVTSLDRGRFVRFPDQYAQLLERRFTSVSAKVVPGGARIPNTGVIMVARLEDSPR